MSYDDLTLIRFRDVGVVYGDRVTGVGSGLDYTLHLSTLMDVTTFMSSCVNRAAPLCYIGRLDKAWRVFTIVPPGVLDVEFPTQEAAIVYAAMLAGGG